MLHSNQYGARPDKSEAIAAGPSNVTYGGGQSGASADFHGL